MVENDGSIEEYKKTTHKLSDDISSSICLVNNELETSLPFEQHFSSFTFDESVSAIFFGRKSCRRRYCFFIFSSILSAGFIYLLSRWLPKFRSWILSVPCSLTEASHVFVKNSFGQEEFLPLENHVVDISIPVPNIKELIDTSSGKVTFLNYRCNMFVLNRMKGVLMPLSDSLETYLSQRYISLCEGLSFDNADFLKKFFGSNEILLAEKSGWQIFYDEILHPFYIFQVASFFIWLYEQYFLYAIIILLMATSSAVLTVMETKRNTDKLREMARYCCQVSIFRDSKMISVPSVDLVPGDLLILEESIELIPCDGILLSGDAVIDESMLTGESVPITKSSILVERGTIEDPMNVDQKELLKKDLLDHLFLIAKAI